MNSSRPPPLEARPWHDGVRDARGLLPHEIFFGLFLAVTWARLVWSAGFFDASSLLYLGLVVSNVAAVWIYHSTDRAWRWRLGLLFYPVAMNLAFLSMKTAIPKLIPGRMDGYLQHLDSAMLGANLSVRMQPLVHPMLTEVFSLCYLLFFPYLLFSMIYYFTGDIAILKKFCIGLFTIYGLGFLGYSLVPAAGPHIAMADRFETPLVGWWITRWNAAVVAKGSNGVDAFPSLHCAISCFFLLFDRRHRPWRFKLYLAPCAGLWLSTLYLRYHYFIDILCGFALAAFAFWVADRDCRRRRKESQTSRRADLPARNSVLTDGAAQPHTPSDPPKSRTST